MKQTETKEIKIITKKLDDACFIDFGTRVVQKKDGGNIYPVYGGGGATFKMDTYNRENRLVVSRFAMSKQCTRFVEGKFYLNDSGLTVRPKNEKELAQEYLDYLLLTLNDTIYSLSRGTAQRNLNVSKFRNLEIKYPDSVTLQLHIANLLSKAENLIAQRKESIRLLDEFLKSTFLEMFGDPVINSKQWRIIKIKDCGKIVTGTTPPSSKDAMFGGEIPFITPSDLESDEPNKRFVTELGAANSRTVRKGATFICCIGATIGKVQRAKVLSAFNQQLNAIEWNNDFNDLFGERLMRFMKPRIITKGGGSTTLPILNKGDFEKIEIIHPPLALQTQFAHIVEKTEALKTQYQQSLQELENLYGSLSQKAFKGELTAKQNSTNP